MIKSFALLLTLLAFSTQAQQTQDNNLERRGDVAAFTLGNGSEIRFVDFDITNRIETGNIDLAYDIDTELLFGDAYSNGDQHMSSGKVVLGLGTLFQDAAGNTIGVLGTVGSRTAASGVLSNNKDAFAVGTKVFIAFREGASIVTSAGHTPKSEVTFIDLSVNKFKIGNGNKYTAELDACFEAHPTGTQYSVNTSLLYKNFVGVTVGCGNLGDVTKKRSSEFFVGGTLRFRLFK